MEKECKTQFDEKEKKWLNIPFFILLIGVLLVVLTLFTPFASSRDDYREYLQEHSEGTYAEELDMTNGEAINLSLFEFGKIYAKAAELGMSKDVSIACLVVIAVFTVFVLLTTFFSILKKPIVAIIFNLLSFGVLKLLIWDFDDRGVIPSNSYDWGIAQYLFYIGMVFVVVGTIVLMIEKRKKKKTIEFSEMIKTEE